jgi:type II secretory pathway component GspD/PulD (secretin)
MRCRLPARRYFHRPFVSLCCVLLAASPALLFGQQEQRERPSERVRSASDAEKPDSTSTSSAPAAQKVAAPAAPAAKPDAGQAAELPKQSVEEQLEHTAEGKIRFNFQGQPWLQVLQWLAKTSKLTLDWQELPEDRLNLSTQTSFTIDEARDLLNMHLAARGFTLLRRGEVLSVVKLDKLNPALVPRVEVDELASRDDHEIVRVSFALDWLVADESVKEFEPMKSPFGKLTPMSSTNRLEALDMVENLRQIHHLLNREQSHPSEERLVVQFKLQHVRAEDIIEKLNTLVGAEANPLRPQDRARMQFMKMRQREEANRNNKNPQNTQHEPEVHLVVNEQENSILVNAPPDKLAVIRQAVQALDVPSAAGSRVSDVATRMKIYRTRAIDPDALSEMIVELVRIGKLQSNTQIQADDSSNTLIVYASPDDHLAIANLISQVEGETRDVHIIKLRQLDTNYALQAVKALLQGEDGGGRWRRRGDGDQFRVEADVDQSRLLLWANDTEFDRVQTLLAKLGEGGQATDARGNVRVLDLPSQGSQQALQNLKRIWPNLRTNPLRIEGIDVKSAPESARQPSSRRSASTEDQPDTHTPVNKTAQDDKTAEPAGGGALAAPATFALAALAGEAIKATGNVPQPQSPAAESKTPATASEQAKPPIAQQPTGESAPSITITESADGRLIITSQDAEALDTLESVIQQIVPPKQDYEVFRLKHASPFSIQLTLEQIFGIGYDSPRTSSSLSVSAAPKLQFISDVDTGTLLVQGASNEQLQKIQSLIDLYDKPESLDDEQQRKTEIYEVKYSEANAVAEVVKEVYRDLLSSNDKAFTREREGGNSSREWGYGVNYGSTIPRFKGLLSLGVEEKSNTLIVSAPAFLMPDVLKLIQQVDEQAAAQRVKVVQLNGVGAETLFGVLSQMPNVTANAPANRQSTGVGSGSPSNGRTDRSGGRSSRFSREQFNELRRRFGDRSGNNNSRNSFRWNSGRN